MFSFGDKLKPGDRFIGLIGFIGSAGGLRPVSLAKLV
jgi:hypothetical protein